MPDRPDADAEADPGPDVPRGPAWRRVALPPGLHLVATPIGAARDITLRALDTLASADVLAAEDTRTLRHLMDLHGIPVGGRPLVPYHDHNGTEMRPRLLAALARGDRVAYASEAGTPLIADPGFQLARAAVTDGHQVIAVPGASAVLAALTVAGLPTDRFLFAGFPPPQAAARARFLRDLSGVAATLVLYESPRRVGECLRSLCEELGTERRAAVCRELTKRFETVERGTLADLRDRFAGDPPRGEIVIVIDRATTRTADAETVAEALRMALATATVRDAAAAVAERLNLPRREVYQQALRLAGKGEE